MVTRYATLLPVGTVEAHVSAVPLTLHGTTSVAHV